MQNYASTQALGLAMAPSVFAFAQPTCGSQVTASFNFGVIGGYYGTPVITVNPSACFPK